MSGGGKNPAEADLLTVHRSPDARLKREERLRKGSEISRVFRSSRRVECPGLKILYQSNSLGRNRVAFVTTKGYRRSVHRNRARRIGREIYRRMKERFPKGYDMVFILHHGHHTYADRQVQFRCLSERLGP